MMNEVRIFEARGVASKQKIRFCSAGDGQRIAFSVQGKGPPAVVAPFCVSHLERDLEEPALRALYERLAEHCTLVRYDHTGVGLSDRARTSFSLERELSELEAVVDALGAPRVTLLGGSFGSPVAIAYAARHPERVSRLLLYGSFACGDAVAPADVQQAMVALVRASFSLGAKALTSILAPHVSPEESRLFTRNQLLSTAGETAAELLALLYRFDVRELAASVSVPTLVVHRRQDAAVPLEAGRDVAARIPGARLLMLEGDVHLPWFGAADAGDAMIEFLSELPLSALSSPESARAEAELTRLGDVWSVGWRGQRFHLKHAKGLSDLATLVQNPGTPVAAITLAQGVGGRALATEVESPSGLEPRAALFPTAAERARKAVQARLRDAILRITQLAPELGAHLERSVATGLHCVYEPESPVRWRVEASRAA